MSWTSWALVAASWAWRLAGLACLAGAGALVAGRKLRTPRALGWAVALLPPLLLSLIALAQHFSYDLVWDTAIVSNLIWNAAYGYGLRTDFLGGHSLLGHHFMLYPFVLAPLVRCGASVPALLVLQGSALGSCVWAVFETARLKTEDSAAPWAAAALLASSPYFAVLSRLPLNGDIFAPALFLWGAYCFLRKRYSSAAVLALLLLTTEEHAPFVIAGWGAYMAATAKGRRRGAGVALTLACAALWAGEMWAIRVARASWRNPLDEWSTFYGALGATPDAAFAALRAKPWLAAWLLVWPPSKLWTIVKTTSAFAFSPWAAGAALLPAAIAWLPNQLADVHSGFHQLAWHYSSFVLGPLAFASAVGLARARGPKLYAAALAVAGAQFFLNSSFSTPNAAPAHWRDSVPKALERIPPTANVWADEYLLPQVSMRRHVARLQGLVPPPFGAFSPDRVLMSLYWMRGGVPADRERVLGFLQANRFRIIFRDEDLLVWAKPEDR